MSVFVHRAGEGGTPVLLLHGIGGSHVSFRAQLGAFAAAHRVLAWDAPGYGASADSGAAPGMSGYARAAASLLDEPAHVVGVSWGGVIATRLAVEHPGVVRSLTLADSTRGSGRTADGAAAMLARADELARLGAEEFARRRAPRLVAPDADPAVLDGVIKIMSGVRLPGYRFAAESMAATDHTGLLGRVQAPTLVVVGEQDQVTGVAEARRLAEGIPGARLEVIAAAGHAANQERPEAFNRLLLEFFGRVGVAA
ncbi:alpha/beta fold hydrolase [Pseudonocardia acaciae]|uniref:alpha/beta fold hydrolase n=1 Tax=Pseudonocardia acaciae TaxID=551276 RepID=UPI000AF6D8B7|nr:alpha/beta fold hydrolase [Pseudonocardia acaciae]